MSAKATFWAWNIDKNIPAGGKSPLNTIQKMVLLRLADHANDEGVCWPGKDTLARACCMSKRTVDLAIQYLVGLQLIAVQKRATEDGKSKPNLYILNYQQGNLFNDSGVQEMQGCRSHTPAGDDTLGVQELQGEGAGAAPESTIESTIEPIKLSSPAAASEVIREYKTKKGKKLIGTRVNRFERFWDAFGYKLGKAEAADAWYQLELADIPRKQQDLIIFAAMETAAARPGLQSAGGTPKMAEGWLSGRRFEDYQEAFEAHRRKPELTSMPVPDPASEWYESWDGITGYAMVYGISHYHYDGQADLISALIDAMEKAKDTVPQALRDRLAFLENQNIPKAAAG